MRRFREDLFEVAIARAARCPVLFLGVSVTGPATDLRISIGFEADHAVIGRGGETGRAVGGPDA